MLRLPAEWEPQSFIQVTFPHENSDWAYLIREVSQCFVEIINAASRFQDVVVVCDDVKRVKSCFQSLENKYFIQTPSNDTWARDHGGITALENNKPKILDFIFNGWGNKFDARLDNQVTKKLHNENLFGDCALESIDIVLEGGAIESDGKGTLLTTSECMLEKNRNPHLSQAQIERMLKQYFGADRILWLDHGYLAGDDTNSHIDTLARFCNENTIAFVGCNNPKDEHYKELQAMHNQLKEFKNKEGKPYRLVELPLPDLCIDSDGNRLPATYANFLMVNKAVLVPVYGVAQDKEAVKILRSCFPEREIIDINCRVLIEQHGSLHCVTMQYPQQVKLNKDIFL